MQLDSFRVRMYRAIRDSGRVPVFPLTALVGRHQSGKTSLLRALKGLDPRLDTPFLPDRDWPRGSRMPISPEHVVCTAEFRLDETLRRRLSRQEAVDPETKGVRVGRTYDGTYLVEEWNGEAFERRPGNGEPPRPGSTLGTLVRDRLPRFLFAEHDSLLPGAIGGDVLAAPAAADEGNGIAALSSLLEAAGLGSDELRGLTPHRARDAGRHVRAVLEEQGFSPGFSLDEERGRVVIFLENSGVRTRADRLPRDRRFRLTLDLRLAAAAQHPGPAPVLLLDGPGRSFRRGARERMRSLFDRYVDGGVTVVYTARMPFELELQHSEQVLVLSPDREGAMVDPCSGDPDPKLAVRAALGMTGRTSFVVDDLNLVVEGSSDARILRELDDLFQRSGEPGLPGDVTLTTAQGAEEVAAVSTFLGRQGLGVIALFDSDGAGATGNEHLRRAARDEPRMERLELLQLAEAADLDQDTAAIEDLFPLDYYLAVARGVCSRDPGQLIARASEAGRGNPAARLSRAFAATGHRFPKGRVTDALADRLAEMSTIEELPPGMEKVARHLMEAIRSAADRIRLPEVPRRECDS